MMKIDILDENNLIGKDNISKIKKYVEGIFLYQKLSKESEICISIVDDKTIRKLNLEYKKLNRATDVLSFTQDGDLLGDVVISFETAKRNALSYNSTTENEIRRLLIHGILHLLGYDHKKKTEREEMRAKEKELYENAGKLDLKL